MKEIEVTWCADCPFHFDDADDGDICYHGVKLRNMWAKPKMPDECPLLQESITVKLVGHE